MCIQLAEKILNMISKKTLLFSIVLLVSTNIFGQTQLNLQSYIPAAPNAAELGKYGSIPVGNVTGVPDISFPLYEIKSGTLSLPIILSYHAGGVQVNQKPPETGLGWSVNAGGQITRTVYGAKDDSQYGLFNYTPPTFSQLSSINNYYTASTYNIASGVGYDLEPDLFAYNIAGKSGKFIINPDKQFVTIPYEPIKITKNNNAGYLAFQIVDENGTIYKYSNYSTVSSDFSSQQTTINTWHLTSIISANLVDTISIEYETKYFNDEMENSNISIGAIETGCNGSAPTYFFGSSAGSGLINKSTSSLNYSEQVVKRIYFKNGYVQFNRNDSRIDILEYSKSLDEIVVYNNTNQPVKKIKLNYDYFYSPTSSQPFHAQYRLKLTGFSNIDLATLQQGNYSFDYDPTALPPFNSYNIDYWGNYNGSSNNSLLPTTTVYTDGNGLLISDNYFSGSFATVVGNASREPDANYMKAGVLNKITYPTGGYTTFDFEPNKYWSDLNNQHVVKIGGGIRVKSIKNFSNEGSLLNEEYYSYGENENGTGIRLFDEDKFYKNYEEQYQAYYKGSELAMVSCNFDYTFLHRNYFGVSKYNSLNYLGAPILYSTVTKYVGTPSINSGKTIYHYNIIKDDTGLPASIINSGNYGAINNVWNQALQVDEINYKWENNQYTPVTRIGYSWTGYNTNTFYAIGLKQTKQFVKLCDCFTSSSGPDPSNASFGQGFFTLYPYPIKTGAMRKTAERRITYKPGAVDSLVVQNYFQYSNPSNLFLTQSSASNSNSDVNITRYTFPQDKSDAISQSMVSRNMLTPVLEEKTYVSKSGSETLLSTRLNSYKFSNNLIVNDNTKFGLYNFPIENRLKYNYYDSYGNILEQQKENDVKETYLWGYKGSYPVAKIIGSDYSTVSSIVNQSQIDNAILSGDASLRSLFNSVRSSLHGIAPAAQLTSFTFAPLIGMTSQTDAAGRTSYYEYDGMNRLKLIRDQDNNIIKKFCYNLFGQTTSCLESNSGNGGGNGSSTPTTVYGVISIQNNYGGYGDLVINFYSDVNCTQPISVTNALVEYSEMTENDLTGELLNYSHTATVSGSSAVLQYSAPVVTYEYASGTYATVYHYYNILNITL